MQTKVGNHTANDNLTNYSLFSMKQCKQSGLALKTKHRYTNELLTCSMPTFFKRLSNVLDGILDEDFDWSNVLFAGGLMSLLLEGDLNATSMSKSDIDLFLYGPLLVVKEKIAYIYNYIMTKYSNKVYVFMYNSTSVFTFLIPGKRPLQVIANLINSNGTQCQHPFKTPQDIFNCFDFTHLQVGYNGEHVIHTNEFLQSMKTRETAIVANVGSVRAYRIVKTYFNRFDIKMPLNHIHIKNTLVCDYQLMIVNSHGIVLPYSADKVRSFENLEDEIYELLENPIVLKNMERNYVPETYSDAYGEQEIKQQYGGEKRDILTIILPEHNITEIIWSTIPHLITPQKF